MLESVANAMYQWYGGTSELKWTAIPAFIYLILDMHGHTVLSAIGTDICTIDGTGWS